MQKRLSVFTVYYRPPCLLRTVLSRDKLLYTGAKDPYAPADHVESLQQELTAAGAHFQIMVFNDAFHAFTDPHAGDMGRAGIAYDPIADHVSWAGTLALLKATLTKS